MSQKARLNVRSNAFTRRSHLNAGNDARRRPNVSEHVVTYRPKQNVFSCHYKDSKSTKNLALCYVLIVTTSSS